MNSKKRLFLEYGIYAALIVLAVFITPKYLMEKIVVDGGSMENTLQDQELVLIEKISRYFDGPERFDIVVFTRNHSYYQKTYIKRVIGLPGETVQIKGSTIYINGEPLEEDFGKDPIVHAGIAENIIILEKGEYFVLGDNRSVSMDSRDENIGKIKKEELDGVVFLRISPWSAFGRVE